MRRRGILAAGAAAVLLAFGLQATHGLASPEQDSLALRFALRGVQPVQDVAVVAIDDVTFSALERQWPFPRRLHARALDKLREAGAARVIYDVQFTEPTTERDDVALYDAVARFPGTVLATTETDERGGTDVLGGDENLAAARARAGAANLVGDRRDVVHRFPYSSGGLRSLAVVAADAAGRAPARSAFPPGGAFIDFRGPPGTIPTVSFSDLLRGRADTGVLRGRTVVVGATAATLQDVHATSAASDRLMSGPEIQANAVWTAAHGLPLRSTPPWVDWLAILVLGLPPALAAARGRAATAMLVAPLLAVLYLAGAQGAFAAGLVAPVSYPLAALALGTGGAVAAAYLAERDHRRRVSLYSEHLEAEVRERTEEVRSTQLEVIRRLGQAVEWRDTDTGDHIERMSTLCERLALAAGMPAAEAEQLRHAVVMHDVGKVGIPDAILRKPGGLDAEEQGVMRSHTLIGDAILAGSPSPLLQLARSIARSHHERWDGWGYPDGLTGDAIPRAARIAAICDVFDALRSPRPYKAAWSLEEALGELEAQRGRQFDPALVDAFLALVPTLEPALLAVREPEPQPQPQPEIGVASLSPRPPVALAPGRRAAAGARAVVAGTSSSVPSAPSRRARG